MQFSNSQSKNCEMLASGPVRVLADSTNLLKHSITEKKRTAIVPDVKLNVSVKRLLAKYRESQKQIGALHIENKKLKASEKKLKDKVDDGKDFCFASSIFSPIIVRACCHSK